MLYRTLVRMIERGKVYGIDKKIDVFYAAGKLSDSEYFSLLEMIHPTPTGEPEPNPDIVPEVPPTDGNETETTPEQAPAEEDVVNVPDPEPEAAQEN